MFRKCTQLFPSAALRLDPINSHQRKHAYWTYSRLQYLRLEYHNRGILSHLPTVIPPQQHTIHTSSSHLKSSDVLFRTISELHPVQESEMKAFFTDTGIQFTEGYTCFTTTCLKFVKEGMKPTKMDKLHINRTTGYFVCEVCKKSGSWDDYKENVENIIQCKKVKTYQCLKDSPKTVDKELNTFWESCPSFDSLTDEEKGHLDHYLGIRHLTDVTLAKYRVRVKPDHSGIVLPVFNPDCTLVRVRVLTVKHRKVKDKDRYSVDAETLPKGSVDGLFGLHLLQNKSRIAILTGSELDAMAAYQGKEGGILALALPRGDSLLPQNVLPYLEKLENLILWLGGDLKEYQNAKQFAWKLDDRRCSVIRPNKDTPSALKALEKELDFEPLLSSAKLVRHKCIVSFSTLRQEVKDEMEQSDTVAGVKWRRYTQLNQLLKGHRRGELTVFTGPTGSGKTTFISDYSVDLAMQGVNTLWGSFEINNVKLLKTMLRQYSQVNLAKNIHKFDDWADKFEQLPMYFMTFHGQESINKVIETMSHAVYVHDIQHVIVDNLQFMMGVVGASQGGMFGANVDRFMQQDKLIAAFRNFATHMNCHITLVIHPRKEREEELQMSSIFGSAKASQEADNVIILQDKRLTSIRGKKYVQITKNRFDGDLGIMMLKFNKDTLSFYKGETKSKETSQEEKDKDSAKQKTTETQEPFAESLCEEQKTTETQEPIAESLCEEQKTTETQEPIAESL